MCFVLGKWLSARWTIPHQGSISKAGGGDNQKGVATEMGIAASRPQWHLYNGGEAQAWIHSFDIVMRYCKGEVSVFHYVMVALNFWSFFTSKGHIENLPKLS